MAMTREEAEAEARRRWGAQGWAEITPPHGACRVGRLHAADGWREVLGRGADFEEAFLDSERLWDAAAAEEEGGGR